MKVFIMVDGIVTMDQRTFYKLLRDIHDAGMKESGKGWNNEYPGKSIFENKLYKKYREINIKSKISYLLVRK